MKIGRFLFWVWMLLGLMLLWIDLISYYNLFGFGDPMPIINRDMNVGFFHCMVTLPYTIILIYLINPIKK